MRKGRAQPQATGELALIAEIAEMFGPITGRLKAVSLGIGDDCAILRPPRGCEMLVTTDFLLEGRHFRRDTHPAMSAGYRCLARGLSDLAAMGGRPVAAFLSLAVPGSIRQRADGRAWMGEFLEGMSRLAERWHVPLAGGDTAQATEEMGVVADIVVTGAAPRAKALRRSGARPGDRLFVTGALGGAAAELSMLFARAAKNRVARLLADWQLRAEAGEYPQMFPQPRLAAGEALRRRGLATAAIDVSDGFSTDLRHLCNASGVRAEVWEAALPVHPLVHKLPRPERTRAVLDGGEDYELLFAAHAEARVPRRIAGTPVTEIGRLLHADAAAPLITLVATDGVRELEPRGWEHFQAEDPSLSFTGRGARLKRVL